MVPRKPPNNQRRKEKHSVGQQFQVKCNRHSLPEADLNCRATPCLLVLLPRIKCAQVEH